MASQRLKRKSLRNIVKSHVRKDSIKRLLSRPTLKRVDIEVLKAQFGKNDAPKVEEKKVAVKEEPAAVVKTVKTSVEEKTAPAKKPAAKKKAEPKAETKEKPAAKKPAAKKPATKKPATKKPVAKKGKED